jgi:hypothetical protein
MCSNASEENCLLDYLVCASKQRRRDRDSDRLRSLEIDHKLKLSRLLCGEIARISRFSIRSTYVAASQKLVNKFGP